MMKLILKYNEKQFFSKFAEMESNIMNEHFVYTKNLQSINLKHQHKWLPLMDYQEKFAQLRIYQDKKHKIFFMLQLHTFVQ